MFQLRSFIHQRLYAAAEEILGEVEKTITLALYEAHEQRPKEEPVGAQEPQPTTAAPTGEEELQETPAQPFTQDESKDEVQGPSETSEGRGFVQIDFGLKVEQEEPAEDGEIQEVIFPSVEIVKLEEDQREVKVSDKRPLVSSDCSEAEIEKNGSDDEWVKNKGAKTKMKRQKPGRCSSAKTGNGLLVCPTCGKGFHYVRPLVKHIKKHKKTSESTKELLSKLQRASQKTFVCDFCGKKFTSAGCLKTHLKIHTGVRDFRCQDCGKTFIQKGHLTVHIRTHSGERPYYCEICGRAFSQKQNLSVHKRRIHSRERLRVSFMKREQSKFACKV